ncbi:MAG: hypothetical protein KatS3mg087_1091 [Patescibacteria group bacterium]|nr:MAG: hypothetical protein KatS3mg087_1091 [Patescibacteria group bacterium]
MIKAQIAETTEQLTIVCFCPPDSFVQIYDPILKHTVSRKSTFFDVCVFSEHVHRYVWHFGPGRPSVAQRRRPIGNALPKCFHLGDSVCVMGKAVYDVGLLELAKTLLGDDMHATKLTISPTHVAFVVDPTHNVTDSPVCVFCSDLT